MATHTRTTPYNKLVTIAVAFGSLVCGRNIVSQRSPVLTTLQTYGFSASVIGSTIGQPGWYNYFNLPQAGEPGYGTTTTNAIATANGIFSAGGAIGSLLVMWAATAFGRKRCIQFGAFMCLLGGALQGGAAALG
jgi:MFS family permease